MKLKIRSCGGAARTLPRLRCCELPARRRRSAPWARHPRAAGGRPYCSRCAPGGCDRHRSPLSLRVLQSGHHRRTKRDWWPPSVQPVSHWPRVGALGARRGDGGRGASIHQLGLEDWPRSRLWLGDATALGARRCAGTAVPVDSEVAVAAATTATAQRRERRLRTRRERRPYDTRTADCAPSLPRRCARGVMVSTPWMAQP